MMRSSMNAIMEIWIESTEDCGNSSCFTIVKFGSVKGVYEILYFHSHTEEPLEDKPKKTKVKQDPRARQTVSSVGRKIHHRHLLLLSETGENLGTFHRADVIRMMEEKQLKLVAVNETADPPVFRLMTGKQIHEEQMKIREKVKSKTGEDHKCIIVVNSIQNSSIIVYITVEVKLG